MSEQQLRNAAYYLAFARAIDVAALGYPDWTRDEKISFVNQLSEVWESRAFALREPADDTARQMIREADGRLAAVLPFLRALKADVIADAVAQGLN